VKSTTSSAGAGTIAKTGPVAAFDWTSAVQVKAVPANDVNQGSSWG